MASSTHETEDVDPNAAVRGILSDGSVKVGTVFGSEALEHRPWSVDGTTRSSAAIRSATDSLARSRRRRRGGGAGLQRIRVELHEINASRARGTKRLPSKLGCLNKVRHDNNSALE